MIAFWSKYEFKVEIIASGTHMSKKFGFSYKEIENDNFKIDWKVDLEIEGDSILDISNYMATGLKKYPEVLVESKPDAAVVLGDRYEALSFAVAVFVVFVGIG